MERPVINNHFIIGSSLPAQTCLLILGRAQMKIISCLSTQHFLITSHLFLYLPLTAPGIKLHVSSVDPSFLFSSACQSQSFFQSLYAKCSCRYSVLVIPELSCPGTVQLWGRQTSVQSCWHPSRVSRLFLGTSLLQLSSFWCPVQHTLD